MPALLIDGHNLIGKLAGFSLSDIDDENRLLGLLQVYTRTRRKRIEVYFDGAPPGQAGTRAVGTVQAVFVPLGNTADSAIRARLAALGKAARNLSVVTSDRMVQSEARSRGAGVISSEDFARDLLSASQEAAAAKDPAQSGRATRGSTRQSRRAPNDSGPALSPKEVDEWLDLFQKGKKK